MCTTRICFLTDDDILSKFIFMTDPEVPSIVPNITQDTSILVFLDPEFRSTYTATNELLDGFAYNIVTYIALTLFIILYL